MLSTSEEEVVERLFMIRSLHNNVYIIYIVSKTAIAACVCKKTLLPLTAPLLLN